MNHQDDSYGWCTVQPHPEDGVREDNYQPLTNFYLYFKGFLGSHPGATPSQPRGGIETLVKMSDR